MSGDADKQEGLCFSGRGLIESAKTVEEFDLIPEGTKFLLQSPSPDWSRRNISLGDLCASAVQPGFEGVEF